MDYVIILLNYGATPKSSCNSKQKSLIFRASILQPSMRLMSKTKPAVALSA